MRNRLIVALDVSSIKKAKLLVDKLYPYVKIFKVGNELFTACGPEAIKMIRKKGAKV
ncbi:MAG: orotidine 5'-phosphate decarboxylase, partial [Candidatus Omnitrophica bacterium]|nr:orotidine 5'-phosphate decarboxylase [Candidatus Omnitrophota bacterium]